MSPRLHSLRRFEIVFTNPQVVYYPGQVLQGEVHVDIDEEAYVEDISIKCRGEAEVEWTEDVPGEEEKRKISDDEDYMDAEIVLFGRGNHGDEVSALPEGNHVYPFQFVLPTTIPGSFEGLHGNFIRYWLKAKIDIPNYKDPKVKAFFNVVSIVDLNQMPDTLNPRQDQNTKTVCCLCCETDPITASLRINKTGFVPGEAIYCDGEIKEGTGKGVDHYKITLYQRTEYRTKHHDRKYYTKECAKLRRGGIEPGGCDVMSGERLVIPALPPSNTPGCNLISVKYTLMLEIDVISTPLDLNIEFDITIGTIPHQVAVQQYMPQMEPGPVTAQPFYGGFQPNFNMAPPAYQESMFGRIDVRNLSDSEDESTVPYAPSYSYYDWMSQAPPVSSDAIVMQPT